GSVLATTGVGTASVRGEGVADCSGLRVPGVSTGALAATSWAGPHSTTETAPAVTAIAAAMLNPPMISALGRARDRSSACGAERGAGPGAGGTLEAGAGPGAGGRLEAGAGRGIGGMLEAGAGPGTGAGPGAGAGPGTGAGPGVMGRSSGTAVAES